MGLGRESSVLPEQPPDRGRVWSELRIPIGSADHMRLRKCMIQHLADGSWINAFLGSNPADRATLHQNPMSDLRPLHHVSIHAEATSQVRRSTYAPVHTSR